MLLDLAGPDQVMLGSDFVWQPMGPNLKDAVEAANLEPTAFNKIFHKIFHGSAQAVFNRRLSELMFLDYAAPNGNRASQPIPGVPAHPGRAQADNLSGA